MKKIVVIGGGNGTQAGLKGLSGNKDVELSVVVSMFDSGGSTGKLRRDFNIPAVGDIRRCFVAMRTPTKQTDVLKDLFGLRFGEGDLKGHNLGNLILVGLLKTSKTAEEAWQKATEMFAVQGKVYPSSMANSQIVAEFENGLVVEGETNIDVPSGNNRDPKLRVKKLYTKPEADAFSPAMEAIKNADLVVIGPGDMYTSVLANFVSKGLPEALQASKAKKAYVCNVLTEPGETYDMSAEEHAAEILKYTGLKKLDYIIVNNKPVDEAKVKEHAEEPGEHKPVAFSEATLKQYAENAVIIDVVNDENPTCHDAAKLAQAILSIL